MRKINQELTSYRKDITIKNAPAKNLTETELTVCKQLDYKFVSWITLAGAAKLRVSA